MGEVEGSGQGGGSPGPYPKGKLRGLAWGSPGPHLGGLKAHTQGGVQALTQGWCIPACTGADSPPPTATAAGSTHPTGMHFCSFTS